jgi:hypothetical protein
LFIKNEGSGCLNQWSYAGIPICNFGNVSNYVAGHHNFEKYHEQDVKAKSKPRTILVSLISGTSNSALYIVELIGL